MSLAVTVIIAGIILYMLFVYDKLLDIFAKGKKLKRSSSEPEISVIIPAKNEEKYIQRKIENILKCYPRNKMKIYVVDNGSTDDTAKIASKLDIIFMSSEPGKINAMNKALEVIDTEVVVVTDADTLLEEASIRNLVSCLHDDVGAAGGVMRLNKKKLWYMQSKDDYHEKDWQTRYKEGLIDSCVSLDGKLMAFRRSLFNKFPENCWQDDYEINFAMKKKGYRCVIDNLAIVHEEAPASFKDEIRQIKNRMRLSIIMNFKKINFLFNPKYGYYSMFIFPSRRFFPLFLPFFGAYLFYELIRYSWLLAILLSSCVVLGLFITRREYMLMQLYGVTLAWIDVLTFRVKKGGIWKKVRS